MSCVGRGVVFRAGIVGRVSEDHLQETQGGGLFTKMMPPLCMDVDISIKVSHSSITDTHNQIYVFARHGLHSVFVELLQRPRLNGTYELAAYRL